MPRCVSRESLSPRLLCGERETRSAGEGRFPRPDLPSAAPSSAFGTFSPAKKPRGRRTLDVTNAREPSKKNLPRRAQNLWVTRTEDTKKSALRGAPALRRSAFLFGRAIRLFENCRHGAVWQRRVHVDADPAADADVGRDEEVLGIGGDEILLRA